MNAKKLLTLLLSTALAFSLAACFFTGGEKTGKDMDSMQSGMVENKTWIKNQLKAVCV